MTYEIQCEDGKALWHVSVALVDNETCQDGVERVKKALNLLIGNGSGIKYIFFLSMPEKDSNQKASLLSDFRQ